MDENKVPDWLDELAKGCEALQREAKYTVGGSLVVGP